MKRKFLLPALFIICTLVFLITVLVGGSYLFRDVGNTTFDENSEKVLLSDNYLLETKLIDSVYSVKLVNNTKQIDYQLFTLTRLNELEYSLFSIGSVNYLMLNRDNLAPAGGHFYSIIRLGESNIDFLNDKQEWKSMSSYNRLDSEVWACLNPKILGDELLFVSAGVNGKCDSMFVVFGQKEYTKYILR